jgi:hypothetical protein
LDKLKGAKLEMLSFIPILKQPVTETALVFCR